MSYILVIDTGSSSMRGVLFDQQGNMCFTEQKYYSMYTVGDTAEYDPIDFSNCLSSICSACAAWSMEKKDVIEAISFTSQRSSILPVKADGTPLTKIMTWYDKRASMISENMNANHGELLYSLAGMKASPIFSAPKIAWLKLNRREIYDAAYKIIGIQDFLIYLCTGRFVTDTSLASRSHLMNVHERIWDKTLLSLYDIDIEKLADLVAPCSIVGHITSSFAEKTGLTAGTPVIAGGGDQQCSVLGQGILHSGACGLTCGSGSYLAAVSDFPILDKEMRVNVNAAITPGQWIIEVNSLSSGTVQDWLNRTFYQKEKDQTYPLERLHMEASSSPAGANGLIMLPDLAGKGCPDWNDQARGSFLNINFSHTRSDFARAMLEGLASEITECYDVLASLLPEIRTLCITGGVTRCELFNQLIADMIDYPIYQCNNMETTAIGAYLAALYGLKKYDTFEDAYASLPHTSPQKLYHPNADAVTIYKKINSYRRRLYDALATCRQQEL